MSALRLSRETGVRQQNLSRWLSEARTLPLVASFYARTCSRSVSLFVPNLSESIVLLTANLCSRYYLLVQNLAGIGVPF